MSTASRETIASAVLPVARFHNDETCLPQVAFEQLQDHLVVIDDKNRLPIGGHLGSPACSTTP